MDVIELMAAPAVEESQWREAGSLVERRAACITEHSWGILQLAAIEVGGWPGADGWVHAVLLRQQTHWHASLIRTQHNYSLSEHQQQHRKEVVTHQSSRPGLLTRSTMIRRITTAANKPDETSNLDSVVYSHAESHLLSPNM